MSVAAGDAELKYWQRVLEGMTRGAVLSLVGMSTETRREQIKEYFGRYGNVRWIEYDPGQDKVLVSNQCFTNCACWCSDYVCVCKIFICWCNDCVLNVYNL